jgi:uncharacterized membrane protein YhaH (DUF805 family)
MKKKKKRVKKDNILKWYITAIKNTFRFSGRARRKEFWYYVLFYFAIGSILTMILSSTLGGENQLTYIIVTVYTTVMLVPGISAGVRRLHDTGCRGFVMLLGLIFPIGWIPLIIILIQHGTIGENRFGPDPRRQPLK